MPWIESKHYYKEFIQSIVNAVNNIPHDKIVWFGLHSRMGLIRDYLAALGIDIECVVDNSSEKQGMRVKREWCLPLTRNYVHLDDKDIDMLVANRVLGGLDVVSPQELLNRVTDIGKTLFITTIKDIGSIKKQLMSMGTTDDRIVHLPADDILWKETCEYFDSIFVQKKPKKLDEHKNTIISILKEFSGFCEKNGLRYYLAYGTLIGAVRHRGIIPWDDDIDVMMPIEDYKKFIEVYPQNQQYEVLDYSTNDEYFFPFAKLVDNRTKLHHAGCPITWYQGEYIDIFPVSGYPKEIDADQWWNEIYLLDVEWYWYYIARDIIPNLEDVRDKIQNRRFEYSYNSAEYVGVMMTLPAKPWKNRASLLFDEIQLNFENGVYKAPKEYDKHLKMIYGNYMELPPIEERETHGFPTYF